MTLLGTSIGWLWLLGLTVAGFLGLPVRRHHFESAGIAFGIGLAAFIAIERRRQRAFVLNAAGKFSPVAGIPAVVAGLVAFAWTLQIGPLSDDFVLFPHAASGDWTPEALTHFRPLPLAIWNLIAVSGGGWRSVHGLNLALHLLNSTLVASLAARWGGRRSGIVAGLVFALLPASTEAVAWSSSVFDLFATLFVLLAIVVWTMRWSLRLSTIGLMLACAAGCLSKESAVAIPALLVLTAVFAPPGRVNDLRSRAAGFVAATTLVVGFALVRLLSSPAVTEHISTWPADRREWKDVLIKPFAALATPIHTDVGVGTASFVLGVAVLTLVGVAVVRSRRNRPAATFEPTEHSDAGPLALLAVGLGWILLSALSLLTQLFLATTLEGGRYLYLPAVGLAFVVGSAFAGHPTARAVRLPALALALLLTVYALDLRQSRDIWREAARTRDALLDAASDVLRTRPCRDLTIADAPDNIRGAFVFRVGLDEAIRSLPQPPAGAPCAYRWDGTTLVPVAAQP